MHLSRAMLSDDTIITVIYVYKYIIYNTIHVWGSFLPPVSTILQSFLGLLFIANIFVDEEIKMRVSSYVKFQLWTVVACGPCDFCGGGDGVFHWLWPISEKVFCPMTEDKPVMAAKLLLGRFSDEIYYAQWHWLLLLLFTIFL